MQVPTCCPMLPLTLADSPLKRIAPYAPHLGDEKESVRGAFHLSQLELKIWQKAWFENSTNKEDWNIATWVSTLLEITASKSTGVDTLFASEALAHHLKWMQWMSNISMFSLAYFPQCLYLFTVALKIIPMGIKDKQICQIWCFHFFFFCDAWLGLMSNQLACLFYL